MALVQLESKHIPIQNMIDPRPGIQLSIAATDGYNGYGKGGPIEFVFLHLAYLCNDPQPGQKTRQEKRLAKKLKCDELHKKRREENARFVAATRELFLYHKYEAP